MSQYDAVILTGADTALAAQDPALAAFVAAGKGIVGVDASGTWGVTAAQGRVAHGSAPA